MRDDIHNRFQSCIKDALLILQFGDQIVHVRDGTFRLDAPVRFHQYSLDFTFGHYKIQRRRRRRDGAVSSSVWLLLSCCIYFNVLRFPCWRRAESRVRYEDIVNTSSGSGEYGMDPHTDE